MSNKSKSRKRKNEIDEIVNWSKRISKVVCAMVELRSAVQKIREVNYPKLAQGGIFYGSSNELIKGGEIVVPFTGFKGATPYDNNQYMFQND